MTMTDRLVPLTDRRGDPLIGHTVEEPPHGSILLSQGLHGTCWQRHFSDGKWHSTTGRPPVEWAWLAKQPRLLLVFEAPPREPVGGHLTPAGDAGDAGEAARTARGETR